MEGCLLSGRNSKRPRVCGSPKLAQRLGHQTHASTLPHLDPFALPPPPRSLRFGCPQSSRSGSDARCVHPHIHTSIHFPAFLEPCYRMQVSCSGWGAPTLCPTPLPYKRLCRRAGCVPRPGHTSTTPLICPPLDTLTLADRMQPPIHTSTPLNISLPPPCSSIHVRAQAA
eukprot:322946-Chlamydomonas_euryale.AAC.1